MVSLVASFGIIVLIIPEQSFQAFKSSNEIIKKSYMKKELIFCRFNLYSFHAIIINKPFSFKCYFIYVFSLLNKFSYRYLLDSQLTLKNSKNL